MDRHEKSPGCLRRKKRIAALAATLLILAAEIFIALFVHDRWLRPYGGDVLVTVLICCFVRIFFPEGLRFLPLGVFLFATAVEVGQYFDFVSLLGLGENRFFSVLLGRSFSVEDILCYAAGCLIFWAAERWIWRKKN